MKISKGVIRIRKSKKERQHNGQKKKDRQHNGQKKKERQHNGQKKKDRQHNGQKKKERQHKQRFTKHTHKNKDRVARTPLKPGVRSGGSERLAFPALLVTPVVLI